MSEHRDEPEVGVIVDDEEAGPRRRRRSGLRIVLGALAVTAIVAASVLRFSEREPSMAGPDALAAAQAFVAAHRAHVHTSDLAIKLPPSSGRAGAEGRVRSHAEIEALDEEHWSELNEVGAESAEQIRIGDVAWARYALEGESLPDSAWVAVDVAEIDALLEASGAEVIDEDLLADELGMTEDEVAAFIEISGRVRFLTGPMGPLDAIAEADAEEIEVVRSSDDVTTLRLPTPSPATDATSAITAKGASSDAGSGLALELDLAADGRPIALRLFGVVGRLSVDIAVRFTDWDFEGPIEPPDDSEVDETPMFDEGTLGAYDGPPAYLPTQLPPGWELYGATVLPPEETFEECEQLMVSYGPAGADPATVSEYLDIYILDEACAVEADPVPFQSSADGSQTRYNGAERLIGQTVIQIDTTLSGDGLAAVIASLAAADPASLAEVEPEHSHGGEVADPTPERMTT